MTVRAPSFHGYCFLRLVTLLNAVFAGKGISYRLSDFPARNAA